MTRHYIECIRSSGSIFGAATALLKENGTVRAFDTIEEAEAEAKRLNETVRSSNVAYRVLA